jgi:hypothetical protein
MYGREARTLEPGSLIFEKTIGSWFVVGCSSLHLPDPKTCIGQVGQDKIFRADTPGGGVFRKKSKKPH